MGDAVRIKSVEGSYLCVDMSNHSSFDAKNTFNFSMYQTLQTFIVSPLRALAPARLSESKLNQNRFSKEIIDKNPKLIHEFTIKDELGRDTNSVGTSQP